jgi:hypothetical protein
VWVGLSGVGGEVVLALGSSELRPAAASGAPSSQGRGDITLDVGLEVHMPFGLHHGPAPNHRAMSFAVRLLAQRIALISGSQDLTISVHTCASSSAKRRGASSLFSRDHASVFSMSELPPSVYPHVPEVRADVQQLHSQRSGPTLRLFRILHFHWRQLESSYERSFNALPTRSVMTISASNPGQVGIQLPLDHRGRTQRKDRPGGPPTRAYMKSLGSEKRHNLSLGLASVGLVHPSSRTPLTSAGGSDPDQNMRAAQGAAPRAARPVGAIGPPTRGLSATLPLPIHRTRRRDVAPHPPFAVGRSQSSPRMEKFPFAPELTSSRHPRPHATPSGSLGTEAQRLIPRPPSWQGNIGSARQHAAIRAPIPLAVHGAQSDRHSRLILHLRAPTLSHTLLEKFMIPDHSDWQSPFLFRKCPLHNLARSILDDPRLNFTA